MSSILGSNFASPPKQENPKHHSEYPTRPTHEPAERKLKEIYNEMRSRQIKAITNHGAMRSDPFFIPDQKAQQAAQSLTDPIQKSAVSLNGDVTVDDRRCLAISAILNSPKMNRWTPEFYKLQERLKNEFGEYGLTFSEEQPEVGGGQLHWTLMQLVGFPDYEAEIESKQDPVYFSQEYLDCVKDSLMVGGLDSAMHITYVGVIAVGTGLLMVGVPSLDINEARDIVRNRLADHNLPLKEPFVNDIVHSTLYRVVGDAENMPKDLHVRLLALAKEYEDVVLGKTILSKFQIGPASWRVLREEIEKTPPALQWSVPVNTAHENYQQSVLDEEGHLGRQHHTISGALGVTLAKELRQKLSRQTSKYESNDGVVITPSPSKESKEGKEITEMQNVEHEVREMIDEVKIHDAVPHVDQAVGDVNMQDNAATITGVSGANLALELRKRLEEEQNQLNNLYYTDFY